MGYFASLEVYFRASAEVEACTNLRELFVDLNHADLPELYF